MEAAQNVGRVGSREGAQVRKSFWFSIQEDTEWTENQRKEKVTNKKTESPTHSLDSLNPVFGF